MQLSLLYYVSNDYYQAQLGTGQLANYKSMPADKAEMQLFRAANDSLCCII